MSDLTITGTDTEWTPPSFPDWNLPCRISTAFIVGLLYDKDRFNHPGMIVEETSSGPFAVPEDMKPFLTSPETLFAKIRQTRDMVLAQKEMWRRRLNTSMTSAGLNLIPYTSAGTYILPDQNGDPIYVIKPGDEDIFCLNDPHHPMPPIEGLRVRHEIPLYHAPEREVAAYQTAYLMGLTVVPRTMMSVISSSQFFDLTDPFKDAKWQSWIYGLKAEDRVAQLLETTGVADKEKLCSIREYAPGTTLLELQHRLSLEDRDEELPELLDFADYEAANIITWIVGNTDNHNANSIAYLKGRGPNGKEVYGLKLIDFGLSFPERNSGLLNMLPEMELGKRKLTEGGKELIAQIPTDAIIGELRLYGLDACIDAFVERVEMLKKMAERELTIAEINDEMSNLGRMPTFMMSMKV